MAATFPPDICRICKQDLHEDNPVAYGDCPVCGYLVCESCEAGYCPETGEMVCPDHADHPKAAHISPDS